MTADDLAEATVLGWLDELCNWGRWGAEEQCGTLNLADARATSRGLKAVRTAKSFGLARQIAPGHTAEHGHSAAPLHHMLRSGESATKGMSSASDWLGLEFHGFAITHLDAPSHVFWDGHMYQGVPAESVSTRHGAKVGNVETMSDGVVTRGVLIDIPRRRGVEWLENGAAVKPDELSAAVEAAGVCLMPGDALLVRTGLDRKRRVMGPHAALQEGNPGMHASCLPWLHEQGVSILCSDGVNDVMPSGYPAINMPIHVVGLVAMGLWLVDNADFEALASACARSGHYEFLFTLSPLRIKHGTGSPVNPVVVL